MDPDPDRLLSDADLQHWFNPPHSFLGSALFTDYFSVHHRQSCLLPYQMLSFWLLILEIFVCLLIVLWNKGFFSLDTVPYRIAVDVIEVSTRYFVQ
jgi:hypothetical protein